jgi:hypothetical protein
MFTSRVRDSVMSCVKLPATVAFPTDDRLLQRIEESRRALPPNSMKALLKSHGRKSIATQSWRRVDGADAQLRLLGAKLAPAIDRMPAHSTRWTLPPTVHVEDVHARSRLAVGRR